MPVKFVYARIVAGYTAVLGVLAAPAFVHAQSQPFGGSNPTFASIVNDFIGIINMIVPVIIGFAFVFFLWGVADWMLHLENEDKRTEAKKFMLYGIVILFLMFSVLGILEILSNTFFN